jgi:hypothetical protein
MPPPPGRRPCRDAIIPGAPGPTCGRRVHRRALVAPALLGVPARHGVASVPFTTYLASLPSPPLTLIFDFFLRFTQRVATKSVIRHITFHGMSAFSLAMCSSLAMRGSPPKSVQDDVPFHVPGFPEDVTITVDEVPHAVAQASVADDPVTRFLVDEVRVQEEAGVSIGRGTGTGMGRTATGEVVENVSLLAYAAGIAHGMAPGVQGVLAGRVPHLRHPRRHRRHHGRWCGHALTPPRRWRGILLPQHRGRGRIRCHDDRHVHLLLSGQLQPVRRHGLQLRHARPCSPSSTVVVAITRASSASRGSLTRSHVG